MGWGNLILTRTFLILSLLITFFPPTGVWAGGMYIETGFGLSQMRNHDAVFGTHDASAVSSGLAANFTLSKILSDESDFLQFHLGIQERYSSSSVGGAALATAATFPVLRLEFPRFFIGLGATPMIYTSQGAGSLQRAGSALVYLAEGALLWRIVPFFHMAAGLGLQAGSYGGRSTFLPTVDATLQFRFFLYNANSGKRRRGNFDGWRYPFGLPL